MSILSIREVPLHIMPNAHFEFHNVSLFSICLKYNGIIPVSSKVHHQKAKVKLILPQQFGK